MIAFVIVFCLLLVGVATAGAIGVVTFFRSVLPELRQKVVVPETPTDPALARIGREEVETLARRRGLPAPLVTVVPILGRPVADTRGAALGTGGLAETRVLRRHGQPPLILLAAQAAVLSRPALRSLLAHELAHAERYSTPSARRRLYSVQACCLALPLAAGLAAALAAHQAGPTAAFTVALLTTMTAGLIVLAIAQAYARREELDADRYAVALTGDLAAAAELMSIYEQSRSTSPSSVAALELLKQLFATHPAPRVRLARMRTHAGPSSPEDAS